MEARRGGQVAAAMEARGWGGEEGRWRRQQWRGGGVRGGGVREWRRGSGRAGPARPFLFIRVMRYPEGGRRRRVSFFFFFPLFYYFH